MVSPDVYYALDEALYFEGRAGAKSSVELLLQRQGSKPRKFVVKSDVNGEWSFAEKVPLEAGDWEVRARTISGAGTAEERASEWSNPRVFKVIVSGITIGRINIKFVALVFIIVVLMLGGGALMLYFGWRVKRLREALDREKAREAHESMRSGFAELRRDLLEELQLLPQSGKQLTREEIFRKEHILRELEGLERTMEREIDSRSGE